MEAERGTPFWQGAVCWSADRQVEALHYCGQTFDVRWSPLACTHADPLINVLDHEVCVRLLAQFETVGPLLADRLAREGGGT